MSGLSFFLDSPTRGASSVEARRELRRVRLRVGAMVLMLIVLLGAYFLLKKSQSYDPTVAGGRIVLYAVMSLNVLLVLAIVVTLFRNIFKLFFDWRGDILGSRFAIKLVVAFLLQGIVPVVFLFLAGSEIIRVASHAWFSDDVRELSESALRLAKAYRTEVDERAMTQAERLGGLLARKNLLTRRGRPRLLGELRRVLRKEDLVGIAVYIPGSAPLQVQDPARLPSRLPKATSAMVSRWQRGERVAQDVEIPGEEAMLSLVGAPVLGNALQPGVVVVASKLDAAMARDALTVARSSEEFARREASRGFVVVTNVSFLMLATLLLLLAAVWMGLTMARGVTVPIQRLAEATQAVGTGNLDYLVTAKAGDELKMLVDSFNRMTRELRESRRALDGTVEDLRQSNEELAERRVFIETVLDTVAAGVVTVDADERITTYNPAASRLLRLGTEARGKKADELFREGGLEEMADLVHETISLQRGRERQLTVSRGHFELVLRIATAPLIAPLDGTITGVVLMLEDLTEVVKAEKASAWREVARRMAHEFKNPLTPIQLSAERTILKVIDAELPPETIEAIQEGASTILREVKTLKGLVDEFSRFARLPEVTLRNGHLNAVVESAVALYEKAVPPERFELCLALDLPTMKIDADQMKRAIVNLVDNALVAMGEDGKVTIRSSLDRERRTIRLEVEDEGPGIPARDRRKLFLPHFSTKKRGTGLGLAIVDRVISDHGGYIKVEERDPHGARFVIDFPYVRASKFLSKPPDRD